MMRMLLLFFFFVTLPAPGQSFDVLALYTAKNDPAHISFVGEANRWWASMAKQHDFNYVPASDWTRLNADTLKKYEVVLFLDTRPESEGQRMAFRQYMEEGGAWMGFHFAAFAMPGSGYPDDWKWYHEDFLGSGNFVSNTWRPTAAVLRVESPGHPATAGLARSFRSQPNEWYRWQNDLRANPEIEILLAIDERSFPLGTGPKPHEIWKEGYYPVAWANRRYRMVYVNMGHNDMDYEGGTNAALSASFGNPDQDRFLLNALFWLAGVKRGQ